VDVEQVVVPAGQPVVVVWANAEPDATRSNIEKAKQRMWWFLDFEF
jgi:hypothetical protein